MHLNQISLPPQKSTTFSPRIVGCTRKLGCGVFPIWVFRDFVSCPVCVCAVMSDFLTYFAHTYFTGRLRKRSLLGYADRQYVFSPHSFLHEQGGLSLRFGWSYADKLEILVRGTLPVGSWRRRGRYTSTPSHHISRCSFIFNFPLHKYRNFHL